MAQIEIIPNSVQLVRMSDTEYFSPKYKDYISNSKLGLLNPREDGSIKKFLTGFKNAYSPSFELGTAIHNMTLQKDDYTIAEITKPNGKLGIFVEKVLIYRRNNQTIAKSMQLASKDADYFAKAFSSTRAKTAIKKGLSFYLKRNKIADDDSILYLSEGIKMKYEECMQGLQNKKIQEILYPKSSILTDVEVYNEYAILGELKVTLDSGKTQVIKIKGKLDNFTVDNDINLITLNDLKTTGKPINFFMGNDVRLLDENDKGYRKWIDGSFQKYHYYRQIAMYLWLLQIALNKPDASYKANMVVVETIPNFSSRIFSIKNKDIKKGLIEMKTLIIMLAEWMSTL
jgi:hypothetical protein